MSTNELKGRLTTAEAMRSFALAGNATLTIRSEKTDARFTYRIQACKDQTAKGLSFVSLLSGPDNEGDYSYLGTIRDGRFFHGKKSRVSAVAPSVVGFAYFMGHLAIDQTPPRLECWHEGRCGRCGRKLTVPESVERGIGPECARRGS